MAPPIEQAAAASSAAVQSGAWGGVAHGIVQLLIRLDPYLPLLLVPLLALAARWWLRQRAAAARHGGVGMHERRAAGAGRVALVLALLAAAWSWAVQAQWAGVVRFDVALSHLAQAWATPVTLALAVFFSDVGDVLALTLVSVAIVAWLLMRGRPALAWGCALAILINSLTVRVLKRLFERERPAGATEWLTSGHSYPSGHAAGSLMVLGLLAWLLWPQLAPRWRSWLALVAVLCIAAIGAARVLLQVHYPSDVLGGWLIAGAVLVLATTQPRPQARGWF